MRRRTAARGFAAALTAFAVFEGWNHDTGAAPFVAGAVLPNVLPGALGRAAHTLPGPFLLGIAGFRLRRRGHQAQVAALGWSARLFLERGLR